MLGTWVILGKKVSVKLSYYNHNRQLIKWWALPTIPNILINMYLSIQTESGISFITFGFYSSANRLYYSQIMSWLTAIAAHDHPLPSCRLPTGYMNTTHDREKTLKSQILVRKIQSTFEINTLEVHMWLHIKKWLEWYSVYCHTDIRYTHLFLS